MGWVDRFVDDARACLCAPDPVHALEALVREVVSAPTALCETVRRRSGTNFVPGFDVFWRSQTLTVFHATLQPRFRNPPHDHGTWAIVGVYAGMERNIFYRRQGQNAVEDHQIDAVAPHVIVLRPGVIHAIANPLSFASCAIHVYGNDHFDASRSMWHPETLIEEPYQMERFRTWTSACEAGAEAADERRGGARARSTDRV
jgi:predicted metal-dependent enzyme (double-stranded beta helix superfamily)